MPLCFWATQTMAASNLLGVGDTNITSYISPNSAASTIQYTYRRHLVRRNRLLLPGLQGPYTSRPGCTSRTEEWAAEMNGYYCSLLASMYRAWARLPFADLVSYLSDLRSLHVDAWPPMSSDYDTMSREYVVQMVLLKGGVVVFGWTGRLVSWPKFSSSSLPF